MCKLFIVKPSVLFTDRKRVVKHLADVDGEKYVVMEEWMKIEPRLPNLIGGEGLGGIATCNDLSIVLQ